MAVVVRSPLPARGLLGFLVTASWRSEQGPCLVLSQKRGDITRFAFEKMSWRIGVSVEHSEQNPYWESCHLLNPTQ